MPQPDASILDDDPDAAELIAARPDLTVHAQDGLLFDGAPLQAIARAYGTPSWVYSASTIRRRFARLRQAFPAAALHYAVKANDHLAVLSLLAAEGAGADVVSGGEILRAIRAGFPPSAIVFSGVGKTEAELTLAIDRGVGQINVESAEELETLSALAAGGSAVVKVALRVNPDVNSGGHEKITTGRAGDKFGIPAAAAARVYARAAVLPGIRPVGLAVHIGSQIFTAGPFLQAYRRLAQLVREIRGLGLSVEMVDCGGGLGVAYRNEPRMLPEAWAGAANQALGGLDLRLAIEPGRWLVAPAGVLLAQVVRTKRQEAGRPVVVLDAAMNDLMRPAMYDAWHGVVAVGPADLVRKAERADIVGPVCESSDVFGRDRKLPPLAPGALVAILDAGAYGAVMSSSYNARPAAAQVWVDDGRISLIRPRQTVEALWEHEILPDRQ